MKYLITGAKGFIGSNLLKEYPTDSVITINEEIFDFHNWTNFLNDFLILNKPDAIFHIGACSNTLESDVNYMMTRNYQFSKILSDWAHTNEIPLIYSSSAACYGENGLHPSNLYGWSKYIAENYILKNGGIGLRYFNVYGPYESHKGIMSSVIYQVLKHSLINPNIEFKIFPKNPKRDFIYVKDVVDANLYALKNYKSLRSNFYDVGYGESRSFEDILNIMNVKIGYKNEESIPQGYQFYTKSNSDKWMPGWKPMYRLERGIEDYIKIIDL